MKCFHVQDAMKGGIQFSRSARGADCAGPRPGKQEKRGREHRSSTGDPVYWVPITLSASNSASSLVREHREEGLGTGKRRSFEE